MLSRCSPNAILLPRFLTRYFQEHEQLKNCSLDLYEGVVRDNKKAGVFEPAIWPTGYSWLDDNVLDLANKIGIILTFL